jgi:NAD(P) transhydrogenase subunit alpha
MTYLSRIALPLAVAALFFAAVDARAGKTKGSAGKHIVLDQGETVTFTVSRAGEAPAEAAAVTTEKAAAPEAGHAKGEMGLLFFVFVLAIFLGFELIAKVPSQLHTPLMSGSNAISGITIVGALIAVERGYHVVTMILGTLAVAFAMINVVGGYVVTDRMLGMFKHKEGGAK